MTNCLQLNLREGALRAPGGHTPTLVARNYRKRDEVKQFETSTFCRVKDEDCEEYAGMRAFAAEQLAWLVALRQRFAWPPKLGFLCVEFVINFL